MRKAFVLLAGMLYVAACGGSDGPEARSPADSARAAQENAAVAAALATIRAVSMAEVEFGEMAAQRAASPALTQYARTVAADHRSLIAVLDSVAQTRGVSPVERRETQELANTVRMAHSGLEALTGGSFELPFVRAEVESHRLLLDRLDQQLIPSATDDDVRSLFTDIRAMTDAHLARARQLLAEQLGQSVEPVRPAAPRPPQPERVDQPPPDPPPGDTSR